mmetsp:Transcript_174933/g.560957  ORF Transcript_174933/g.560957 Transcript_174933/m.560957 type:complete len:227 (-) Transcript_174933:476-1156(-)
MPLDGGDGGLDVARSGHAGRPEVDVGHHAAEGHRQEPSQRDPAGAPLGRGQQRKGGPGRGQQLQRPARRRLLLSSCQEPHLRLRQPARCCRRRRCRPVALGGRGVQERENHRGASKGAWRGRRGDRRRRPRGRFSSRARRKVQRDPRQRAGTGRVCRQEGLALERPEALPKLEASARARTQAANQEIAQQLQRPEEGPARGQERKPRHLRQLGPRSVLHLRPWLSM